MNWKLRFFLAVLIEYPLCLIVSSLFSLLALVLVPLAYWFGEVGPNNRALIGWRVFSAPFGDGRRIRAWRWEPWMYPWGNEEDGIDGLPMKDGMVFKNQFWQQKTQGWSDFKRIFNWCVLRNSASNLRFMPVTGYKIDPSAMQLGAHELLDVKDYGDVVAHSGEWYFVWEGWRSTLYIEWKGVHFLIGWNQRPEDADQMPAPTGLDPTDTRAPGVSFKLQLRRNK